MYLGIHLGFSQVVVQKIVDQSGTEVEPTQDLIFAVSKALGEGEYFDYDEIDDLIRKALEEENYMLDCDFEKEEEMHIYNLVLDQVRDQDKHRITKKDGKYLVDNCFETEDIREVLGYISKPTKD